MLTFFKKKTIQISYIGYTLPFRTTKKCYCDHSVHICILKLIISDISILYIFRTKSDRNACI